MSIIGNDFITLTKHLFIYTLYVFKSLTELMTVKFVKTPNNPDIKTNDTQGVITGPDQQGAEKDHDRHGGGVRRGIDRRRRRE